MFSLGSDNTAGHQLDGKQLYVQQRQRCAQPDFLPAPTIVATNLKIIENKGGVLRLAEAAGCQRVIFVSDTDHHNLQKVKRAARSSETLVAWENQSYAQFLANELPHLPPLIAIEITSQSSSLFETRLPVHCTFVIGNEQHGISPAVLQHCQQAVHIPMYGINGSMNVSHALAVVLFEWRRQHM
ncbi:MAG: TrmH family RNA methyltransferase [Anaerolineae bacterium]|nr:TrmH family RNA methyltransferase [Anaerolineae bacterium]